MTPPTTRNDTFQQPKTILVLRISCVLTLMAWITSSMTYVQPFQGAMLRDGALFWSISGLRVVGALAALTLLSFGVLHIVRSSHSVAVKILLVLAVSAGLSPLYFWFIWKRPNGPPSPPIEG